MTPIQLLVVDDHNLFRRGLIALLSLDTRFRVCGEAADIGEALRRIEHERPDLILLDNHLPGVRGVDGIASLKEASPDARILMLTVSENEDDLTAALQAGADGYLLKTVELDHLSSYIIKVLDGEPVISPEMMAKLLTAFRAKSPKPSANETSTEPEPETEHAQPGHVPAEVGLALLSTREREVLALIANGDSNKVIARKLDIAETTVKIHVHNILRKLQLSSRVQAAVYATDPAAGLSKIKPGPV
jgi:two-component system nitrate/nitrite response regulator NarL